MISSSKLTKAANQWTGCRAVPSEFTICEFIQQFHVIKRRKCDFSLARCIINSGRVSIRVLLCTGQSYIHVANQVAELEQD